MTKESILKNKIGQMLIMGFKGTEINVQDSIVEVILAQSIGGVILFDYNFQFKTSDHNIKNPKQLKRLTEGLQAYAKQAATKNGHAYHPLFISIDYEGGKVNRLQEKYGFPFTRTAAEIGLQSIEAAKEDAEKMAATLKEAGINVNFAPVLDVNSHPDNPVIGKLSRSFSSDAQKVTQYAAIFSEAYQNAGIISAYKHFPGHGSSSKDTHTDFVDITQTWQQEELAPYQQLLPLFADSAMVMTSHVVHYGLDPLGYPASISHAITQNLLRNQLKFNGVVVTDDMQMKALTDHFGLAEAVRLAVNAGADILVFGNQLVETPQNPQQIINILYQDVIAGKIAESRIEQAYQRILLLKQGLCKPDGCNPVA